MKHKIKSETAAKKHTDIQKVPLRVPPRLEGVVKNKGVRPEKKKPKK